MRLRNLPLCLGILLGIHCGTEAPTEPLADAEITQAVQKLNLPDDGAADKKRPHCCTYHDPVRLGCVQTNDNDVFAFARCVKEIGTNFTMSRGECKAPPCDYIRYK